MYFRLKEDGILTDINKFYVIDPFELRKLILQEMHNVPYAKHQGYQNTLAVVRKEYFWLGMKKYIAYYIARCMECRMVKVEHRHPTRFL